MRNKRRITFEKGDEGRCIVSYLRTPEERVEYLERNRNMPDVDSSIAAERKYILNAPLDNALSYIIAECRIDRNPLEIAISLDESDADRIRHRFLLEKELIVSYLGLE